MTDIGRIARPRRALVAISIATAVVTIAIAAWPRTSAAPARTTASTPKVLRFQVVALAVDQLQGGYAAAVRLYDVYIGHILDMADMLSSRIIQEFPAKFS